MGTGWRGGGGGFDERGGTTISYGLKKGGGSRGRNGAVPDGAVGSPVCGGVG